MMKNLILMFLLLMSTTTLAREIHCVVHDVYAPYSDINLYKKKGNKYEMKVFLEDELLLTEQVSFKFSRRARVATFKGQSVEIKTIGLVANMGVRGQFKIQKISKLPYNGLCKLFKD
ncbi:putative exported protein [Halobacteriovorax marinus SJ]|uniref:Exported protein n=1 Tax=Halobacteriovorax marinus (strain ATCC BAA-682 / DSM 15412 / SJ) TaxID=862908 RepID=E1X0H5_HALMS|nr:hypothetical protein [Halobacteriovorax marinus]CBW28001.1 putative exported protein [Halobacteriovorax marinus SJ]